MDKDRKKFLMKELGKYCLDVSKLVLGGVILTGIMKQKIEDYTTLFVVGGVVFFIFLFGGFILFWKLK